MRLRSHLGGAVMASHVGDAPRVLGLHGWGRTGEDLSRVLEGLDHVVVDLPGFGRSPEPAEALTSAEYAEVVAEFLREADLGPLVVLGHSFGGRVAVRLAAAHPDLVSGLCLVGVPLVPRAASGARPALAYRVVRWANRVGLVSDERMERARQRHGSADYRAATPTMRATLVSVVGEDYREDLAHLSCPVVLCWGSQDSAAPLELAREAAQAIPDLVGLRVLDGDHFVHRTHAEEVRAALEEVLDR